jgi:hypothetical protein
MHPAPAPVKPTEAAENAYREACARVARRNTHAARAARVEARIALMRLGVPDPDAPADPHD